MQNIYTLNNISSLIVLDFLAERVKQHRLEKGWSREQLSVLSGVPTPTIAYFERKHHIALRQFIDLAVALGYGHEFDHLLLDTHYDSLEELEQMKNNKKRKHGRITINK